MKHLERLTPQAREALDLSIEAKILFIKIEKFINNPKAQKLLDMLDNLKNEPDRDRYTSFSRR